MLQLVKAAGFLPNFSELNEEQSYSMMTSLMELVRMIRDGDSESFDDVARNLYSQLNEA